MGGNINLVEKGEIMLFPIGVFLMFAAIATLQYLEWKYYIDPPKNAFPPYGIGPEDIPIPGGSSVSSAPVSDGMDDFDDMGDNDLSED